MGEALRRLSETGAASVEATLREGARDAALREVAGAAFTALPAEIGPVRQEADLALIRDDFGSWPTVARIRSELVKDLRLHGAGLRGLAEWWPNEAYVQRYRAGALGVTAHLDSRRFVILVAVFTLSGSASFALCSGRSGDVIEECEAGPGSLILLRAPGFDGVADGRPFHRVLGPTTGERLSLTFRMNAKEAHGTG